MKLFQFEAFAIEELVSMEPMTFLVPFVKSEIVAIHHCGPLDVSTPKLISYLLPATSVIGIRHEYPIPSPPKGVQPAPGPGIAPSPFQIENIARSEIVPSAKIPLD